MTNANDNAKSAKKFPWAWLIAGAVVLLLFGACSFAFVGMFKNIDVVKPIVGEFIEVTLGDQLPKVASGRYSDESGITDESIEPINALIASLGNPEEIGEANCSARSSTSTDELSGEFVMCTTLVTYPVSPATVSTTWRKENEVWKLLRFHINVDDVDAYNQLTTDADNDDQKNLPKP